MHYARYVIAAVLSAASLISATPVALAQGTYPTKPIRLVVPFPPGTPIDTYARRMTPVWGAQLNGQFVVENKPGAAGTIAAADVARAPGDGYTLLYTLPEALIGATVTMKGLPYDPRKDFRLITKILGGSTVTVTSATSGIRSIRELIAEAKKGGGKISYASWGPGSIPQMIFETLARQQGVTLTEVPYKGSPDAIRDMLGGQLTVVWSAYSVFKSGIDDGKIVPIGITGSRRLPSLANVPTFREQGFSNFIFDYDFWVGLVGPSGLSPATTERLAVMVREAYKDDGLVKFLTATSNFPVANSPAEFEREFRAEFETFTRILREELKVQAQ